MIEPSPQLQSLLSAVSDAIGQGDLPGVPPTMEAVLQRQSDFACPLSARLAGIAMDPAARDLAEQYLDDYWAGPQRRQATLTTLTASATATAREVIIGGGFHAAVYAAVRVLSGHPRPLVLEREDRAGGTFAMTRRASFTLNSRNRGGPGGLAGDLGASLNFLPGALVQAADLSMAEYQTNADMAFVIRLTLAQFADVVTGAQVTAVTTATGDGIRAGEGLRLELAGLPSLLAGRVIDARGVGDPLAQADCDGAVSVTFAQFMTRMATTPWPLRGIRRAAVVGGGDSARCAVESLLGIAPQPPMAAAALDPLDLVDWYADGLPAACEQWQQQVRGRYQAIGPALRPDRLGRRRLRVLNRRVRPLTLPGTPGMGLIDGRSYDLMVLCTGNQETPIGGLDPDAFDEYPLPGSIAGSSSAGGSPVARKHYAMNVYRVGPHARLPFTIRERDDGIADIPANAVSMFRTASKTASLAATLPPAASR